MSRIWKIDMATVFTTHATLLGRMLCAGKMNNLYHYFNHCVCLSTHLSIHHTRVVHSYLVNDKFDYLLLLRPDPQSFGKKLEKFGKMQKNF